MNNYTTAEINDFSQKENGYLALFCLRLGNLCVKADAQAMMPVTVTLENSEYNFEDVAEATKPNDYTFDTTPKNENSTLAIKDAKENAEKLLNTKLDEIEEGYQRYLMGEDNGWENDYKEDTSVDLSELS